MREPVDAAGTASLIPRGVPAASDIAESGRFAWEIVRRRGDYHGSSAQVQYLRTGATPVELIEVYTEVDRWGLLFRGGAGAPAKHGTHFLEPPP